MRRLHRLEQSLSERFFSPSSDRSVGRHNSRPSSNEFPWCFPRIPLDTTGLGQSWENVFCHSHWELPLQGDAFQFEKRWVYVLEDDDQDVWITNGSYIEVYIDDMVVKSKIVSEHIGDLTNIFEILRGHKLRLNTSKCSFGVGSGKFLGYMVTHRGIEVNPDQIKAINSLQPPWNPKEVQKLTGMMVTLNRFISRSTDRCRPFFLLMNKWKGFEWTEECAQAFQQLKEYLFHSPIMSSPETDEVLFAYIVVAPHAVSLVLIRVDSGRQRPVYYVSKSLHEVEICYLPLEKAISVVVHGTRKLPYYFQAHTVVILT